MTPFNMADPSLEGGAKILFDKEIPIEIRIQD